MTYYLNLISGCLLSLSVINYTKGAILSCIRAHDTEIDLSGIVGQELVRESENLNRLLEEKTSSKEIDDNMKILTDLYKVDKGKIFKKDRSKTLKAESLFLALDSLTNESSCNSKGHEIIYQAHRALEGKPFIDENFSCCHRRIDKIFLHYYRQHAYICKDIYPREMRRKLKTMDPLKVRRVNFFADNAISQFTTDEFVGNRFQPLADKLFEIISAETDPRPRFMFKILKFMLKNQPEDGFFDCCYETNSNRPVLNKKEFKRIFEEYLAEPCKYYEEQLGPDIFVPLSFSRELHEVNSTDPAFYKNWARYRFCSNFASQSKSKRRELYKYSTYRLDSIARKRPPNSNCILD